MNTWVVPGYREERVLGEGGAGRVVLATYSATGAYVAIKYLKDKLRRDPEFLAGFRAEARVMVELDNPHIVRLYEYVETMAGAAIVMELVDGISLRRLLAEHGATSPEAALVVLKGSLLGMSAAHAMGVVHRDYKPENVLVQADGMTKLSDFGIAARSGQPGNPSGTPSYMAPEQWDGGRATPATDVYAATCVFFECLTGHRPYRGEHGLALLHQHKNAPIPLLEVPSEVRGLVARGMAKNPADRPTTARAFLTELEAVALEAYGPEWEQRGRRHLAELATLLALLFPLAGPTPRVSSALAQSRLGAPRAGRAMGRLQRNAPRVAIGSGAIMAAIVISLVLTMGPANLTLGGGDRRPSRIAPTQVVAEPPPGGGGDRSDAGPGNVRPTGIAPATNSGGGSTAGGGRPTFSPAGNEADTGPDDTRESPDPPRPEKNPSPTPSPSLVEPPEPTFAPSPTPTPTSVPDTPATTPTQTPTPTPTPADVEVEALRILRFDGDTVTAQVNTSGPGVATLSVRFAQGSSADELTPAGPPRTFALFGRTTHTVTTSAGLAAPACGTRIVRRVTVATTPDAPGGERSETITVSGPPCAPPAGCDTRGAAPGPDESACPTRVRSLSVDSWNGRRAAVSVTTDGGGPVTLSARFTVRRGEGEAREAGAVSRRLSGATRYTPVLSASLPAIPCGGSAVVEVTVSTDPAAPGGAVSRRTRVPGPRCAPPRVRIVSWNGSAVRVAVTTSTTDPVTVTASFRQRAVGAGAPIVRTATRATTVSGRTSHLVTLSTRFARPSCGTDTRTVVVSTSPAAAARASRTVSLPLPPCAPEEPKPDPEPSQAPPPQPKATPETKPETKPEPDEPGSPEGSAGGSDEGSAGGSGGDSGDSGGPVIR